MKQNAMAVGKSIRDSAFLRSSVAAFFARHRFIWKNRLFQENEMLFIKIYFQITGFTLFFKCFIL